MNSMQLKDKLKNIVKDKNINFNILLKFYMYDRFIERLSKSRYKDNFILKGGFYLSTLFGIENRSTMDIDTAFRNDDFSEKRILEIINEIISIDNDDNIEMEFLSVEPIRDEDEYGGFRVTILSKLENIKEIFHVDIATGDPITPKEIKYKYRPFLYEKDIEVWAYNIETVISEKIESILERGALNGRMKDYYDIYYIFTKHWNIVNKKHLNMAIEKTFKKRNYNGNPFEDIELIKKSKSIIVNWNSYSKKNSYAKVISFDKIIECIEKVLENIDFEFLNCSIK